MKRIFIVQAVVLSYLVFVCLIWRAGSADKRMKYLRLLIILAYACHLSESRAFAQRDAGPPVAGQVKVGMVTRNFTDDHRKNWEGTAARPLKTAVWYPAAATSARTEAIFGGPPDREVFAPVAVAPGADVSKDAREYPLVLLSHGTGGAAVQMMW